MEIIKVAFYSLHNDMTKHSIDVRIYFRTCDKWHNVVVMLLMGYMTFPGLYITDATMEAVMMTSSNGNIFCVTGHLRREFTDHRWIPRTKASDAELWFFLWSAPE